MAYQFIIVDEDNWAPSWREQYRRIEKQVNDDLIKQRDPAIGQGYLSRGARAQNEILIDQIKGEYRRTGTKEGCIQNDKFGIELSYSVDAQDWDDLWVDLGVQHITAKKSEYARLINYRFLYRDGSEHEFGIKHVQSLKIMGLEDFRNKVKGINSKSLTRLYNYFASMQILNKPLCDDNITYTIIYDALRGKLILGNIDISDVKFDSGVKTLEILIPSFIDEIQHISTLIRYTDFRDIDIKIKLESVKPLVMTNLYQYQMMDLYNIEGPESLLKTKAFEGYIASGTDLKEYLDGQAYNIYQMNIELDLTDLQLEAISISDIEDQINKQNIGTSKQLARTRIIKQLEKSNKYISRTTKTLSIKATDLYDLVELNGREYKSREGWIKTYYDELQDYIDIDKNPYLGLPSMLPCNFTTNMIRLSNKTVQDAVNLRGLLSYIGAETVIMSNDLDNFDELDESDSDEVYDLFGDKNVDGMLENSRINEIKLENMSDYEDDIIRREYKRSRAELKDKIETYIRK